MVRQDYELVTKEILAPFFNDRRDGGELPDINGGAKEGGAEWLAEEGDGVISLGKHHTHPDTGGVCFHEKR